MLHDTVVIEGEVSLISQIDGDPDVCIGGGGSQPTGTKSILLTEAGTKTEDVTAYASAEINAVTDASASGAVASFSDGAEDVPMDSCVVDIEPVQSGSGAPSPSNVRPISGWSEVNVYVSPTLSAQDATVYHVSLGQTVYGGTLDVVSGVLTVDRAIVGLGSLTWYYNAPIFNTPASALPNKAQGNFNIISDNYATANSESTADMANEEIKGSSSTTNIYVRDDRFTDATSFKQWLANNGVKLVYELATAQTIQLTPTEVTTLLGSNNVWADSGDIAVWYKADVYLTEGGITPTGTKSISITSNGTTTENVTNYASASITTNVPASAVDTGTKSISSNGTHDVIGYASASVAVPNSYSASDEGKVVSNGALVAQSSDTVTANDTYDTTLINSLTVNVSGGVDTLAARCNGTLTTYSSNAITTVANYAFTGSGIQSLELPNCTEIGSNGLRGLTTLTNLKIHNVTKLNMDALNGSSAFTVLAIPKCTSTTTRSFNNNTNLKTLEIATCSAQLAAVKLTTIILRKNSVVTLDATSNLNSTVWGSSGTGGTLYVPSDLVSSYQSASNWSTILGYTNNQIKSIESTHTDPTAPIDLTLYYADGSPLDE